MGRMTGTPRQRLSSPTLLHARAGTLPDYDRAGPPVIAHLGFGAFARAHLAVYADELLRRGHPALISGVSLRSRRAQQQLEPQDGLFSVAVREPGEETTLQVVGALTSMKTGPAAALEAMTLPTTSLVTVTITEKGYEDSVDGLTASGGPFDAAAAPTTAALIAQALAQRRREGVAPPVFASLDNLLDNGGMLRARVLQAAATIDPALAAWIAEEVRFPSSVVDRMVPAPTEGSRRDIADELGLLDEAAVATERHRSWIMRSVDGLDRLGEVGVELVDDIDPFERRKLWLLNGPHSAAAYGGLLAGYTTIEAALADPVVARFVRGLVEQTLEVATLPPALQPAAFADDALRRFANPALGHTCAQVGADGSSKLPQRLLPVVAARRARSLHTPTFATVAAIWIACVAGVDVRGVALPRLQDPIAEDLRAATARCGALGDLSRRALGDTAFAAEVASMLERLTTEGPRVLGAEE
jgi:fructuronate reductase